MIISLKLKEEDKTTLGWKSVDVLSLYPSKTYIHKTAFNSEHYKNHIKSSQESDIVEGFGMHVHKQEALVRADGVLMTTSWDILSDEINEGVYVEAASTNNVRHLS